MGENEELVRQLLDALKPYIAQGQAMRGLVIHSADIPRGIVLPQPWHLAAAERAKTAAEAALTP